MWNTMQVDDWKARFGGRRFITDLGRSEEAELDGVPIMLDRYAVWVPHGEGHRIVEVGGGLEDLRRRYDIPEEDVCLLLREAAT